jgi:phosphoribosylglycinamide formyltransferase-1
MTMQTKIAIFCSGSGSNAQKIMEYFQHSTTVKVEILIANKPDAYALERAKAFQIPTYIFDRNAFYNTNEVVNKLKELKVDWVILAGFLWLIPPNLIEHYPNKIVNIHPALLPKFGGKGMYGMHVHEAVVKNKEKESGISIHYVNSNYDEGNIIFQASCPINPQDNAEVVAKKVLTLEHAHYPKIIESLVNEKK